MIPPSTDRNVATGDEGGTGGGQIFTCNTKKRIDSVAPAKGTIKGWNKLSGFGALGLN